MLIKLNVKLSFEVYLEVFACNAAALSEPPPFSELDRKWNKNLVKRVRGVVCEARETIPPTTFCFFGRLHLVPFNRIKNALYRLEPSPVCLCRSILCF